MRDLIESAGYLVRRESDGRQCFLVEVYVRLYWWAPLRLKLLAVLEM